MKSTSEVGHNKNVANFNALSLILQEMGTLYNPSNLNIQLASITPLSATIAAAMANINQKKPLYTNAVAARELAIEPLGKKASKILNSFKSLSANPIDKENLTSLVKKIRGDKKLIKPDANTSDSNTISTSQQSYDSKIANLDTLIGFIGNHPAYSPNEEELKITTLNTYNQELKTLTQQVNIFGNSLITARKERNNLLYRGTNNIIELAKEIKSYLKSLGDEGQSYYKAAIRLKFVEIG